MATQCHNQLTLGFQPKIVLDFNGGEITSDSGLLLLRQFDAQLARLNSVRFLAARHVGGLQNTEIAPVLDWASIARRLVEVDDDAIQSASRIDFADHLTD